MQILRKTDVAVICFFVVLAVALIFVFAAAGTRVGAFVAVFADGVEVFVIDIEQNNGEKFEIVSRNGINVVLVEDGTARMVYADCPDLYCVGMGAILGRFQTITCLPNRVVVEIRVGGVDDADIIAH